MKHRIIWGSVGLVFAVILALLILPQDSRSVLLFTQRVGPDPHGPDGYARESGGRSPALAGCPDIWELSNGDYAVIGIRKTNELKGILPETAGCGPDEEIVVIPRQLLIDARASIPAE